jgi:hypothetical protein
MINHKHFGYRILRMSDVNVSVLPIKRILGKFIRRTYPKKIGEYSGLLNCLSNFFLRLSLLGQNVDPAYYFFIFLRGGRLGLNLELHTC